MLKEHLDGLSARPKVRVAELKHLRDRLLKLQFISIELDNEDDAYLIFETLNTRGKDLRVSDLVKNLFTRLIKPRTKGMDVSRDTWSEITHALASVTTPIDPDTFLLHYWLASQDYVSKARLFKAMKSEIRSANAERFLNDIRDASGAYIAATAPADAKWSKEERSLSDSLAAL